MNEEKIEIKEIQKKLKQLSQKQVELEKSHHQQFFLYRWLQGPDPELQSVKEEIARLEKDKDNYFKILQAAASVPPPIPEKDWSKTPLYSKTVQKLIGAETPFEQYGLYGSIIGGLYLISRSLFRSYHAMKAIEFPLGSEDRLFHSFLGRATEEQLRHVKFFTRQLRTRGILSGIFLPTAFICYILQKHKK